MIAKHCYSEEERRKEARKYLHKIEATDNRIKEMIQEINALQDKALFIPNAKTDDVKVKGSQPHEARYENYIVKKIEIERQMDEELAHLVDIKMQVRNTISQVSDDRCQLILRYRYINLLSWKEIQDKLSIGERTAYMVSALYRTSLLADLQLRTAFT